MTKIALMIVALFAASVAHAEVTTENVASRDTALAGAREGSQKDAAPAAAVVPATESKETAPVAEAKDETKTKTEAKAGEPAAAQPTTAEKKSASSGETAAEKK